jgi:hypothetical protein
MSDSIQYIFSYGTLQDPAVQEAVFGRRIPSLPDELPGFVLDRVRIVDPDVIAKSGRDEHPILRRSPAGGASVMGSALAVEPEDVAKADAYEVADYRRIAVTLSSGRNAYVYVAAEDAIDDLIPAEE